MVVNIDIFLSPMHNWLILKACRAKEEFQIKCLHLRKSNRIPFPKNMLITKSPMGDPIFCFFSKVKFFHKFLANHGEIGNSLNFFLGLTFIRMGKKIDIAPHSHANWNTNEIHFQATSQANQSLKAA